MLQHLIWGDLYSSHSEFTYLWQAGTMSVTIQDKFITSCYFIMSHPSLLIANPTLVAEKVIAMQEKGADGLHILADFDSTLTKSLYQ